MRQEDHLSEANLNEHFDTSGYHLVDEHNEPLSQNDCLEVSEITEPFDYEHLVQENSSPIDEYLEKIKNRFYKQPKVRFVDYLPLKDLSDA